MYCIALLKPSGGFQQLNTFASQKTPQINSPLAKAICILHFNKVSSNYKKQYEVFRDKSIIETNTSNSFRKH